MVVLDLENILHVPLLKGNWFCLFSNSSIITQNVLNDFLRIQTELVWVCVQGNKTMLTRHNLQRN